MLKEIRKGDYAAQFDVERGMNFVTFKKGVIEALDLSTRPLFEQRFAGLGALIGPHFHHRQHPPSFDDASIFPHIASLKERGEKEFFSHGIGRYVAWDVKSANEQSIEAHLNGDMEIQGVPLKVIEGQDFKMKYIATMLEEGLQIELFVAGEGPTVVGLHTYYAMGKKGTVTSNVKPVYNVGGEFRALPEEWDYKESKLVYPIKSETDYGFLSTDPLQGDVLLQTTTHKIRMQYWSTNEEASWQLWHPKESSFVCVEPIAAKNPRKPCLSVNQIKIVISIIP